MRVLLVDDEEAFVNLLAERLETRGITVLVAHDVASALDLLAAHPVDVAVLDVCMPGRDGLDLLRVMRERHPLVEALMLTGSSDVRNAVEGMRLGACNYLLKPVDIEELLRELRLAHERKIRREESARMIEAGKLASMGRMAEGVAHEINNPVNIIANAAGWIEDLLEEPDIASGPHVAEMRRTLAKIKQQGVRVREITRKLLCFGRGLDPRPQPVACATLLRETLQLVASRCEALAVDVVVDLPEGLPEIMAPPVELRQVFLHVIENALDAMEENGGTLTVRLRLMHGQDEEHDALHVAITDTGHGIAPALLPRVFDPFFSTRSVGRGMGLGLSVSYGVVRALGGDINLTSDPGRAVCSIRLPLTAKPPCAREA